MKLYNVTIANETYENVSCNIRNNIYILSDKKNTLLVDFCEKEKLYKKILQFCLRKKIKIHFLENICMEIPTKCRLKKNEQSLSYELKKGNYKIEINHIRESVNAFTISIIIRLRRLSSSYILHREDAKDILRNQINMSIRGQKRPTSTTSVTPSCSASSSCNDLLSLEDNVSDEKIKRISSKSFPINENQMNDYYSRAERNLNKYYMG